MKVELKETDTLERQLSVEVEPETVQTAMEKKFLEIRRTAELKGFRKGKAPLDIIKSLYADQAKLDVVDDLIKQTYPQAVQEKALRVATRPTVTDLDFNDDGSVVYIAKVEVFPDVTAVNCEDMTLEMVDVEVTDDEVGEVVELYRKRYSELRPLDREVQDGDVVVADLTKLFDSKGALPGDSFTDSEIDLANKFTVQEFKDQLPGMKVDDEKEFTVKYDEDYSDPGFAGAEIRYRCVVKAVKERILPEFNDAFAKSTGQAETALELRMKIRGDLVKRLEENQVRMHKRQVIQQVCDKNEIPIPMGLVSEYLDSIVAELKEQKTELSEAEIREQYRQVGINSLRWDILWHQLAEQENIEVLPQDTEKWINGFAAANEMTPQQAEETLKQSGKAASLRESIHEEKVLGFLIEKATKKHLNK